jgi:hypothetical protein
MGIFSKLFGGKQAGGQPGESFSVMRATLEGRTLFASINMAYKSFSARAAFPWHLNVLVPLADPTTDGLTTNEEASELNGLEDQIAAQLAQVCKCHYIGRITWAGTRQMLYYLDDPEPAARRLQEMMDSGLHKAFTFRCGKDSEWKSVSQFWR